LLIGIFMLLDPYHQKERGLILYLMQRIGSLPRAAQKGQQWQRCCQEISLKKLSRQEISLRTIHARKSGNI
jgi:hypothetical protein